MQVVKMALRSVPGWVFCLYFVRLHKRPCIRDSNCGEVVSTSYKWPAYPSGQTNTVGLKSTTRSHGSHGSQGSGVRDQQPAWEMEIALDLGVG